MALRHLNRSSNDVRVPAVDRGEAVVVTRYGHDPKAVVVNPDDYAMLEETHDLLLSIAQLEPFAAGAVARRAALDESTPSGQAIEDPERLRAMFGLAD